MINQLAIADDQARGRGVSAAGPSGVTPEKMTDLRSSERLKFDFSDVARQRDLNGRLRPRICRTDSNGWI
jgi:hypothetical protein